MCGLAHTLSCCLLLALHSQPLLLPFPQLLLRPPLERCDVANAGAAAGARMQMHPERGWCFVQISCSGDDLDRSRSPWHVCGEGCVRRVARASAARTAPV